jgi:hypothetical protein
MLSGGIGRKRVMRIALHADDAVKRRFTQEVKTCSH